MKLKIVLLGASGSIGTSTCHCIRRYPDRFELVGISVNKNIEKAHELVNEFGVKALCITSNEVYQQEHTHFKSSLKIFKGPAGIHELLNTVECDIVVNALVGACGFKPTVTALHLKKRVALANKESLVIGGDYIQMLLKNGYGELLPIDSEHSAILQCLSGSAKETVESITITASGGPFRTTHKDYFSQITPEQALNHPVWSMGNKITIDSSTLMNKGFEIIEAHHLFAMEYSHLKVVIHPQSIVHSFVTFRDGAVIAQCGIPDMELPIQYALTYPYRLELPKKRLDFIEVGSLTFEKPDVHRFPCLHLSLEAGKSGGTLPTVLNAANEVAVHMFLNKTIAFTQIPEIIESALTLHKKQNSDSVEIIEHIDTETRQLIFKKFT